QRERQFALGRQDRDGTPVIPVLLPGADPGLDFLMLNNWVDFRQGTTDPQEWDLFVGAITGTPPGPALQRRIEATRKTICPYRGLSAFREDDEKFFFGREVVIERLVAATARAKRKGLVALLGASGSGKSSVVQAGLLPRLRQSHDGKVWDAVT